MRCLFVPALVRCALVGVSSAAQTFKEVGYLYKSEGKDKGHLVDGALVLDNSRVAFQSKTTALDIPIASITNIGYERASKPRYAAGLLFAWPLLFTKSKQHYLTFQYTDGAAGKYAVLGWTREISARFLPRRRQQPPRKSSALKRSDF
jgi:hypothetical protein